MGAVRLVGCNFGRQAEFNLLKRVSSIVDNKEATIMYVTLLQCHYMISIVPSFVTHSTILHSNPNPNIHELH